MKVSEFADKNGLRVLALPYDREITGCYIGDLLSWVMGKAKTGDAWITIMSNQNVLAVASLSDVACVIFAEGVTPDEAVIALANEKEINLLTTELSAYEAARLI